MLSPEDRGLATTVTGGGGSAAMSIRQPTQHEPMQILLLVSSGKGAGSPAGLWHKTPPGCIAMSAAALAKPKLEITLASAIA
jgi:hypothetical protein